MIDARPSGSPSSPVNPHTNRITAASSRTWWKRPFDLTLGGVIALAGVPLLAVLALLVRVDSPGPIFFRQERIGRDGVPFQMLKFRSMHDRSEDAVHRTAAAAWFAGNSVGGRYKSLADPRITRVGRFLRWTSLDELPQLFNVLGGAMSLVGPRPGIAYELEYYEPWYFARQNVKPGITGLWQVAGRDKVSAETMMRLDVRYVRDCSPWLDLKILLWTVPALLGLTFEVQ